METMFLDKWLLEGFNKTLKEKLNANASDRTYDTTVLLDKITNDAGECCWMKDCNYFDYECVDIPFMVEGRTSNPDDFDEDNNYICEPDDVAEHACEVLSDLFNSQYSLRVDDCEIIVEEIDNNLVVTKNWYEPAHLCFDPGASTDAEGEFETEGRVLYKVTVRVRGTDGVWNAAYNASRLLACMRELQNIWAEQPVGYHRDRYLNKIKKVFDEFQHYARLINRDRFNDVFIQIPGRDPITCLAFRRGDSNYNHGDPIEICRTLLKIKGACFLCYK